MANDKATTPAAKPVTTRIASLDQFRGYTVAGMFLVNFVGTFAVTPVLLKHHNTFFSYADTIMPQFFFAVGFAFRLTFGRREQTQGLAAAYGHAARRLLGLALVALVVYKAPTAAATWQTLVEKGPWEALRGSFKDWFQTLMHIAVTSLWILPVIRAGALVRVAYMIASAALQVGLSYWFYFDWVNAHGIDGGILGFLAWTIPTMVGTLACDAVAAPNSRAPLAKMILGSAILMGLGWLVSCGTTLYDVPQEQVAAVDEQRIDDDRAPVKQRFAEDPVVPSRERLDGHKLAWAEPPFVPPPDSDHRQENYWMMSQRAATLSYHTFGAGFSLAIFALFYIVSDLVGWQLALFRTLGTNALIGYILHGMVADAVERFMPKDSPGWYVTAGFLLYFGITWLFLRHLEKNKINIKL
jgi:predicted acyltransferase